MKRRAARQPANVVPKFVRARSRNLRELMGLVKAYYRFDGIRFHAAEVKRGLRTLLRNSRLGRVWLVRVRGEVAGYVVLTFGFDAEFGGRLGTITDFYLEPGYRRYGLGTKTLRHVELACRRHGIRTLELQALRRNRAAQAFYKKLGFEARDRIPFGKRLAPYVAGRFSRREKIR